MLSSAFLNAQNEEAAFSKSYAFEYDAQYSKAISSLLELNSNAYQVNLRLGWLYFLSKDYTASESYYKKAIVLEQSSIEARFGIVLPMSAQGNWNNVLSTYMDILKLDANNSIANYRIAVIYYNRKDYANSSLYINKVIKMYPFDYDSNLMLGKIYIAQAKNAEAKKHIIIALEYNPQSEEAKTLLKKL